MHLNFLAFDSCGMFNILMPIYVTNEESIKLLQAALQELPDREWLHNPHHSSYLYI